MKVYKFYTESYSKTSSYRDDDDGIITTTDHWSILKMSVFDANDSLKKYAEEKTKEFKELVSLRDQMNKRLFHFGCKEYNGDLPDGVYMQSGHLCLSFTDVKQIDRRIEPIYYVVRDGMSVRVSCFSDMPKFSIPLVGRNEYRASFRGYKATPYGDAPNKVSISETYQVIAEIVRKEHEGRKIIFEFNTDTIASSATDELSTNTIGDFFDFTKLK